MPDPTDAESDAAFDLLPPASLAINQSPIAQTNDHTASDTPSRMTYAEWLATVVPSMEPEQQTYLGCIQQKRRPIYAMRYADVDQAQLDSWRLDETFRVAEKLSRAIAWNQGGALSRLVLDAGSTAAALRLVDAVDHAPHYRDRIHAADRVLTGAGVMPTGQTTIDTRVQLNVLSDLSWHMRLRKGLPAAAEASDDLRQE